MYRRKRKRQEEAEAARLVAERAREHPDANQG
jgi:hypothetical protein